MDKTVAALLTAYRRLTPAQKQEFLRNLDSLNKGGYLEESVVKDMRMGMGPLGTPCPLCGK